MIRGFINYFDNIFIMYQSIYIDIGIAFALINIGIDIMLIHFSRKKPAISWLQMYWNNEHICQNSTQLLAHFFKTHGLISGDQFLSVLFPLWHMLFPNTYTQSLMGWMDQLALKTRIKGLV